MTECTVFPQIVSAKFSAENILFSKCEMWKFSYKGPFKYYISKEVGGWGSQLLMFADKVGGWGWPNADVSKK